jgi:hypothetical protein
VILQVVVLVRHKDGEDQAQKEFAEIGLRSAAFALMKSTISV